MGADYLGLQNAGAEYLGPFFAKSGAEYLGGADYLSGGAEYLGTAKSGGQNTWARPKVGQNTWARPKVGQITWDDFSCFPSSPSPAVLLPSLVGGEPRELTPKRFLSENPDFATSRRDARQLFVGQE